MSLLPPCYLLWRSRSLSVRSGSHDASFSTKLQLLHSEPGFTERRYKFVVYDLDIDDHDQADEHDVVGEAVLRSGQLAAGSVLSVELTKNGRTVKDCHLVINPPVDKADVKSAGPARQFPVAISCKGFPILSKNDAMVSACFRDQKTGRWVFVGQTERVAYVPSLSACC